MSQTDDLDIIDGANDGSDNNEKFFDSKFKESDLHDISSIPLMAFSKQ